MLQEKISEIQYKYFIKVKVQSAIELISLSSEVSELKQLLLLLVSSMNKILSSDDQVVASSLSTSLLLKGNFFC